MKNLGGVYGELLRLRDSSRTEMTGVTQTTLPDTSWLSEIKPVTTEFTILFDVVSEKQAFLNQNFFLHALRTQTDWELGHTKAVADALNPRTHMFKVHEMFSCYLTVKLFHCSFPQQALENFTSKISTEVTEEQCQIWFEASVVAAVSDQLVVLISSEIAEQSFYFAADFVFAAGFKPIRVFSPMQFALEHESELNLSGFPVCDFCKGFGKHKHTSREEGRSWRVCESCGGRAHSLEYCPFNSAPHNSDIIIRRPHACLSWPPPFKGSLWNNDC